jgi:glucose/arabinose dehydrogenase
VTRICLPALSAVLAAAVLTNAPPAHAAMPPPGFTQSVVASGLTMPTAMAFTPDGRLLVAQQTGALRVVKAGALLTTPFVTLPVNSDGERGLLGVAVDPAFTTNHFVYLYYTATTPTIHNRLSRFTANGDTAAPGSEVALLDLPSLGATNHNGGAVHFGLDGKLYIGVGENAVASRAQDLSNPFGKLLRLNPNGSVPADNPFVGTPGADSRIWAYGLRNPFTFAFDPATGMLFINDVGASTWEEVNVGRRGANYGWPITEGPTSDPRFVSPLHAYTHADGCAIAGGAFYRAGAPQFPGNYVGDYFFADLCEGWIHRLDTPSYSFDPFTAPASGTSPVDIQVASDGSLWYLTRGPSTGAVTRMTFRGARPDLQWSIRNSNTPGPPDVSLAYGSTGDQVLSCDWNGDGTDSVGVYSNGFWYLRNTNTPGAPDITVNYGVFGYQAVCGDWNGDGTDTIGVYAGGSWFLRNSNTPGAPDISIAYGIASYTPVVGDWNGDGTDTIGVYDSGSWFLRNTNTPGAPNVTVNYGAFAYQPAAGDWNRDGTDTIGVFNNGFWYLRNTNTPGAPNITVNYGVANYRPIAGDWDGDGTATIGVVPNAG